VRGLPFRLVHAPEKSLVLSFAGRREMSTELIVAMNGTELRSEPTDRNAVSQACQSAAH
jgi:hypothetical protein